MAGIYQFVVLLSIDFLYAVPGHGQLYMYTEHVLGPALYTHPQCTVVSPHVVLVRDPYNLLTDVKESIFVLKLLLLLLYFLPVTLSPCFSLSFYSCSLFISLIYLAYTYLRTYLLQLL